MENSELVQKENDFIHFMDATILVATHVAQATAFGVVAFAVGYGWWPAWFVLVVIGVATGAPLRRRSVFWAMQLVQAVVLAAAGVTFTLVNPG